MRKDSCYRIIKGVYEDLIEFDRKLNPAYLERQQQLWLKKDDVEGYKKDLETISRWNHEDLRKWIDTYRSIGGKRDVSKYEEAIS